MNFLKPDLVRSFAIGFALGCVALFATLGVGGSGNGVVPAAIAAQSR